MIVENWDSFYQQAVDLYRNNPLKTRFVTKYRHCDGKLVLKVTDDSTVRWLMPCCLAAAARPSALTPFSLLHLSACNTRRINRQT